MGVFTAPGGFSCAVIQNVVRDRGVEQAVDAGGVFGLAENPHELSRDGLGRHVERFEHLRAFADLVPDLINADVAALVLHLRGQNDGLAALNALLQHGQEVIPVIRRDAAHAEAFQDQRIVVPEHPVPSRSHSLILQRDALLTIVPSNSTGSKTATGDMVEDMDGRYSLSLEEPSIIIMNVI